MGIYDDVDVALHRAGVLHVVVGGTAVVLQGHGPADHRPRSVVDLAAEPAAAAMRALTGLGLQPRLPVQASDFADEVTRREWVEHRNLVVFSLFDPASPTREVDVFATEPLPFADLERDATVFVIAGVPVQELDDH